MTWDPWAAAEGRLHVQLVWRKLPEETGGAAVVRQEGVAVVFLDPRLSGPERRVALAHELIHDERGGGAWHPDQVDTWGAVVAAEECRVDVEVARRLVPVTELLEAAEAAWDFGHQVTAAELAAEYEVPRATAEQAMRLLLGRSSRIA